MYQVIPRKVMINSYVYREASAIMMNITRSEIEMLDKLAVY